MTHRPTSALTMAFAAAWLAACAGPAASLPPPSPPPRSPASTPITEQAVCAAAAPRAVRVTAGRELPELGGDEIAAIRVRASEPHAERARSLISSRVGTRIDPSVVRADIEKLWALRLFEDIAVEASVGDDGLVLTYLLEARPPTGKLFFRGVTSLPAHTLDDVVQLRPGEPFDPRELAWTQLMLAEAYQAAGYRFVKIEPHQLRDEQVHVCLEVDEGPRVTIATWSFEGARQLSESELRQAMDTRDATVNVKGGVFRPEVWEVDALRILALYYDRGYVEAQIGEPQLVHSDDRSRLDVTIPVAEGRAYRVGSVSFSGAALAAGKDYASVLTLRSGETFSRSKAMEDLARIRAFHEAVSGFTPQLDVTPITQLHPDRGVVDIDYQVQ